MRQKNISLNPNNDLYAFMVCIPKVYKKIKITKTQIEEALFFDYTIIKSMLSNAMD